MTADLKVLSFEPVPPTSGSKFKTGDKVKLKGDSQSMTVQHADKEGVTAKWTSEFGEPQTETYLEEMLEFVPARKRKRRVIREIVFTPDPKPRARKVYRGKGAK
jgi:uncharacterized protein YodC (DUF2158 family)